MAHADYDCCAVCDSKQSFSYDATSKEVVCSYCAVALAQHGVIARNGKELKAWIETADVEVMRHILSEVGFRFCYYQNDVDDAVRANGIEMNTESRLVVA